MDLAIVPIHDKRRSQKGNENESKKSEIIITIEVILNPEIVQITSKSFQS